MANADASKGTIAGTSIGEPLLTDIQAAPLIGLAAQTLRNDRVSRRLGVPYYKVGKCARYKRSDLERWLAQHAVGAAEAA